MDVTKQDHIKAVKQFVIKYLNDTNSILWGIVNNAGFAIAGQFELIPKEYDNLQRNVLLNGPINIIREFLPLIHGRKEYKLNQSDGARDGGRIINIASCYSKMIGDCRYGVCKAALSYFTHALRLELWPRFGICTCSIEPGGYNTNIWQNSIIWAQKINNTQLMDIYQFDIDKLKLLIEKIPSITHHSFDPVVDDVIHGLTSKYPQKEYQPGWNWIITICAYGPFFVTQRLNAFFSR